MAKYAHGKKKSSKKFITGILIVVGLVALFYASFYITKCVTKSNYDPVDMSKYADATPEELREIIKEKDEEIERLERELENLRGKSPQATISPSEPIKTPPKTTQPPSATAAPTTAPTATPTAAPTPAPTAVPTSAPTTGA